MNNYEWHIVGFETRNVPNADGDLLSSVVCRIKWKRVLRDAAGTTVAYLGKTDFDPANIVAGNFVNFSDISESIAVSWVEGGMSGSRLELIDSGLAKQLSEKNTIKKDPPWWNK